MILCDLGRGERIHNKNGYWTDEVIRKRQKSVCFNAELIQTSLNMPQLLWGGRSGDQKLAVRFQIQILACISKLLNPLEKQNKTKHSLFRKLSVSKNLLPSSSKRIVELSAPLCEVTGCGSSALGCFIFTYPIQVKKIELDWTITPFFLQLGRCCQFPF